MDQFLSSTIAIWNSASYQTKLSGGEWVPVLGKNWPMSVQHFDCAILTFHWKRLWYCCSSHFVCYTYNKDLHYSQYLKKLDYSVFCCRSVSQTVGHCHWHHPHRQWCWLQRTWPGSHDPLLPQSGGRARCPRDPRVSGMSERHWLYWWQIYRLHHPADYNYNQTTIKKL